MKYSLINKLFIILILANCKDSNVRNFSENENNDSFKEKVVVLSEKDTFTLNDFKNTIQLAKKFHLDGDKINDSVALADAAAAAVENLNVNLYFYSESYYREHEGTSIPIGNIHKTSPTDSFILLKLNNKSVIQNKNESNSKERASKNLKEKQEIYNSLVKLKFTEEEFERIISYVNQNYSKITNKEKPLALMNNLFFSAANGYLRSLDPYSIITKVNLDDDITTTNENDSKLNEISGKYLKTEKLIYIKIPSFSIFGEENSVQLIKNIYNNLQNELSKEKDSARGIILDLRDNPGGYLDLVIDTVDLFLEDGEILITKIKGKSNESAYAKKSVITKLPIGILVNSKTASGAEIVAGSLQENKRAILFGERTFGNGSIQKLMSLPENNSFVLKVTVSRYFLPSGISTQVNGLIPDILISSEEDGSFPERLREEDKWKHLPSLKTENEFISVYDVDKINKLISLKGKSNFEQTEFKIHGQADYALIRSLDAFDAYLKVHHN